MRYTGKLIGYTRSGLSTPNGDIECEDGVNYELLDQLVDQQAEVIIAIDDDPFSRFLSGITAALNDWRRAFVIVVALAGVRGSAYCPRRINDMDIVCNVERHKRSNSLLVEQR